MWILVFITFIRPISNIIIIIIANPGFKTPDRSLAPGGRTVRRWEGLAAGAVAPEEADYCNIGSSCDESAINALWDIKTRRAQP